MDRSRRLAGLIGPTMVLLTTSEVLNYRIWATNTPAGVYLNGCILFVAGLAILRAHYVWKGWPALITLTGVVNLLGGLYRMFFPEAPQGPAGAPTYVVILGFGAVGAFLTFKAYWPSPRA